MIAEVRGVKGVGKVAQVRSEKDATIHEAKAVRGRTGRTGSNSKGWLRSSYFDTKKGQGIRTDPNLKRRTKTEQKGRSIGQSSTGKRVESLSKARHQKGIGYPG